MMKGGREERKEKKGSICVQDMGRLNFPVHYIQYTSVYQNMLPYTLTVFMKNTIKKIPRDILWA